MLSFVTSGGAAAVGAGVATARAISCAGNIIKVPAALKVVRAVGVVARSLPELTKQKPGSLKDADPVRVMDPTDRCPNGYVRYHNKDNQPTGLDGKPDSKAHTHIRRNPDGSWPTRDGWNP